MPPGKCNWLYVSHFETEFEFRLHRTTYFRVAKPFYGKLEPFKKAWLGVQAFA